MLPAITLTFGDRAENHVGNQVIGQLAPTPLTLADLEAASTRFQQQGIQCDLFDLRAAAGFTETDCEPAYFLLAYQGVKALLPPEATFQQLWTEQTALEWDTKVWMKGRVVNKQARHNLCYSDVAQEPDYEQKEGRIVDFPSIPLTRSLRDSLPLLFGEKCLELQGEGNYYTDLKGSGIGFHGDTERRIVVAVRLGNPFPLYYQWYQESKKIGPLLEILLKEGDVYAMSSKAVGYDWLRKKVMTLRHAAGSKKYTKL